MVVYYAHSMHLYNTKQENRDVEALCELGFDVLNPNTKTISEGIEKYREQHGDANVMDYFKKIIDGCDMLIFRAHPDGKIPSGVAFEVNYAKEIGIPILELPTLTSVRNLSVDDTRQYLSLLGQR